MTNVQIDKSKTFFNSQFLEDYYSGKLDSLMSFEPNIKGVKDALKYRSHFPNERRIQLVNVLEEQYHESGIDVSTGLVGDNIRSLISDKSFTVTTGQQIHIGLGPLYVYYKILDTLAIVNELKEEYDGFNFVPVFWMATEDHDLEEIRTIPLFGNKYTWETDQGGAVGRMSTKGVKKVFEDIEANVRLDSDMQEFILRCKDIYSTSVNLSIAFRRLLHSYFVESGLVIIDGDSKGLKESFIPVLEDELAGNNHSALEETTERLESYGHKRQVVVRETNLFKLSEGERTKVQNVEPKEASELIEDIVNLSPNALLRPLYQEWVLPNLAYVGGQAEVKYWMQLKGLFLNYNMELPVIHNRSSLISIPEKMTKKIEVDSWDIFFQSQDEVLSYFDEELKKAKESLEEKFDQIKKAMDLYSSDVETTLNGFSVHSKMGKLWSNMLNTKGLVDSEFLKHSTNSSSSKRALKLQGKYFQNDLIQERTEHIIGHLGLFLCLEELRAECFGFKNVQKIAIVFT